MKRVLVVDDEPPVVDRIVRLIGRIPSTPYTVVGTAASGRETLEALATLAPDILVLDVRMPGLSGLDTVRELRRRGHNPAIVLSTAYERFDIAREALELGISGYVLKPVEAEALERALATAADQLDRRLEVVSQAVSAREETSLLRQWAGDAYVLSVLLGRDPGALEALAQGLGLARPWLVVAAVALVHHPDAGRRAIEEAVQYKGTGVCGPLVDGRCAVVLALGDPSDAPGLQRAVEQAVPGTRLAWSDVAAPEAASRLWTQALGRLTLGGRGGEPLVQVEDEALFEQALDEALDSGDAGRLAEAFDRLLERFEAAAQIRVADRYRLVVQLGGALMRLERSGRLDPDLARAALDFDDLLTATDGAGVALAARSRLPVLSSALHRARRWSGPLQRALDVVRASYAAPLTLDSVAEACGLSPKRLSKLFVDELGQGFSDYLIAYRIAEAKVLLALPGASVKQVSRDCGYPDPNYFARLFRKETGLTPTEWASRAGIRLPVRPTDGIIEE